MNCTQHSKDVFIQSDAFQVQNAALEPPFVHITGSDTQIWGHGIPVSFPQLQSGLQLKGKIRITTTLEIAKELLTGVFPPSQIILPLVHSN